MSVGGTARYKMTDRVLRTTSRDAVGIVIQDRFRQNGEYWYRVAFGASIQAVLEDDLEPFVEAAGIEESIEAGIYASSETLSRRVTLAKLAAPLRDAIYSLDSSRTEFHAYQFKPLLKFLASEKNRILIADEVGLGKTIEAGYILREQKARFDIDRVLIVCPAALRRKWQSELYHRFGEEFEIFDSPRLRAWLAADTGQKRLAGIVSMQTLRHGSVQQMLDSRATPLDLLIVDEAHHCRNSETAQHQAVRQLTVGSEAIVFLTATPLHLRNDDLFNLLRLLLPEDFDRIDVFNQRLAVNEHIVRAQTALRSSTPGRVKFAADSLRLAASGADPFEFSSNRLFERVLRRLEQTAETDTTAIVEVGEDLSRLNLISHVVTRTQKRQVFPDASIRNPVILPVDVTQAERIAYDTVLNFCSEHYARTVGNFAAQFPLITLQRQMASSIPAMLEHYQSVLNDRGPEDDEELIDDDAPERPVPLTQIPGFAGLIDDLLALPLAKQDTKLAKLIYVLKQKEKVVVFSYFRGSLRYLERRLTEAGVTCTRIDGSVPYNPNNPAEDERQLRITSFKDPAGPRVLLSSEVGSEGLDFQFCHTLVNWDLPWNPMVVEQRIGRLDRLGQKADRITIINFATPGTIEERVLNRLYKRVGLFEGTIGPLEPILGAAIKKLTAELLSPDLDAKQREERIERAALALEQKKQEERRFEEAGPALFGQDDLLRDRLHRIRRLGRYVTPDELNLFISDFLSLEYPDSALRSRYDGTRTRDAGENCYWLRVEPALRDFVRRSARRLDEPALVRFLERTTAGELKVTFDPQAALNQPAVEHVHHQHPLVKAVVWFLNENPERIRPVCRLTLRSDLVAPGLYGFFWAEVIEEGLQAGRSLWTDVEGSQGPIEPDRAEQLLHEMTLNGAPWPEFEPPPATDALELLQQLHARVAARCQARKLQAQEENESRVDLRLASLRASARAKRRIIEQQIDHHTVQGNQQILPAVRGRLRKVDADFAQREEELERGRKVTVRYEPKGFGFVRVVTM